MTCGECGARVTASEKKKLNKTSGKIETYVYYHCTKRKKYIDCKAQPVTVSKLEDDIVKTIETNLIDPEFYKLGLETWKEVHELETDQRQKIYEAQFKNVEETEKKLDRALTFLFDGTVTKEQYNIQKQELEKLLTREKDKLAQTEKRATNWRELTENVLHFSALAVEALKHGDVQVRRETLSSLGWNHRIESKKLFINLHSWFTVLKKGEEELLPEIKALELEKIVDKQRRMEAFATIRPRLCVGKDSNLRSPKAPDLQSSAIDHSATDAFSILIIPSSALLLIVPASAE